MRWLQAAIQVAQRKYRLTNLLLLLLRCLLIALLALALAQPNFSGVGRGGHLVLIVDTTASMGELNGKTGALREAVAQLQSAELHHRRLTIITVGDGVHLRDESSIISGLETLRRLEVSRLPGGVDLAAQDEHADRVLRATTKESDVVIISDFRQDDGTGLVSLLEDQSRSCSRWRVAPGNNNALITGVTGTSDLVPGMPGELLLQISGDAKVASVSIDDGQASERRLQINGQTARLSLPPLDAGKHHIRISLSDDGLTYDNVIELPLMVRKTVPVVIIEPRRSPLGAALLSDAHRLDAREESLSTLTSLPLPSNGIIALRQNYTGDGKRLRSWVEDGGVLWCPWPVLQSNTELSALVPDLGKNISTGKGGKLHSPQEALNANLGRVSLPVVQELSWPATTEFLLHAGDNALIGMVPVGKGLVICETENIANIPGIDSLAAWPLWVRQTAREATARLHRPSFLESGLSVQQDVQLERLGRHVSLSANDLALLEPGLWRNTTQGSDLVILPNKHEGQLQQPAPQGVVRELIEALPQQPGANWGPALLLLLLLLAITECAFAAWAGKTYGR